MRHIAANAMTLLLVALVLMFGLIVWGERQYSAPGPLKAPLVMTVDKGEALPSVAAKLAEGGAISNATLFRIAARYTKQDAGVKYGEYEFPPAPRCSRILGLLNQGGNVIRQIIVPEGLDQLAGRRHAERARRADGRCLGDPGRRVAGAGPAMTSSAATAGGGHRPDAGRAAEDPDDAWTHRASDLPLRSPEDLLTLASIVEKETGVPEERGEVASVFVNQLVRACGCRPTPR